MEIPAPEELRERVRGLPAFAPLAARLPEAPPVYLVGGGVRDLLLGVEPSELDLVVEGDAAAVAAVLGGEHRDHPRFGTIAVALAGRTFDIAAARRESYAHPGALPDVVPGPIAADLERRDFTVNAIVLALNGPRPGALIHVPAALEDLAARVLRVLHPASFTDDPTRLLRMARYRARLGFEVESRTATLAAAARDGGALATVSGARIGSELRLLARERDPVSGFAVLRELSLDRAIRPGLGLADTGLARAALALLAGEGRPDLLVLGLAIAGVAEPERRQLLERFAFRAADSAVILQVAGAVAGDGGLAATLARAARASELAAALAGTGPEAVAAAGASGGGVTAEAARRWLTELRHVRLEISGADLAAAGIAPGPAIGRGLRTALAAKLDGRAVGREAELAVALEAAS